MAARARPVVRPVNRQPPRKVPSSDAVAVHTAAAETGHLAHGVHPGHRRAVGPAAPGPRGRSPVRRGSCGSARAAARRRAARRCRPPLARPPGVEQLVRRRHPHQPVADEPAGRGDRHHLRILAEAAAHLQVALPRSPPAAPRRRSGAHRRAGSSSRPARRTVPAVRKSTPRSAKACTSGVGPGRSRPASRPQVLAGQVAVLLRAGQAELLAHRLGVEHEPGVRVPARR